MPVHAFPRPGERSTLERWRDVAVSSKGIAILSVAAVSLFLFMADPLHSITRRRGGHLPKPDSGALYFLSMGDGGTASRTQHVVARQMGVAAKYYNASFVLGLGDNYYDSGVVDLSDPQFKEKFEGVYTHPSLRAVPWYMALGDHDHRLNVTAQVAYSAVNPMWHMPGQWYSVHQEAPGGIKVHIVVTDSIPLEALWARGEPRRWGDEFNEATSGRGAGEAQLQWLEAELASSDADWLVVTGHRPVVSGCLRSREPAEAHYMEELLGVMARHGVDVWLNGHDHTAQYIRRKGVAVIVNGLGGYGVHPVEDVPGTVWKSSAFNGFAVHQVTAGEMVVTWVDTHGRAVHSVRIPRRAMAHGRRGAGHSRRHVRPEIL